VGVTSRNSAGTATIGIATEFLDGVYQVAKIDNVSAAVVKVHVNISSNHGLNFTD